MSYQWNFLACIENIELGHTNIALWCYFPAKNEPRSSAGLIGTFQNEECTLGQAAEQ
jgi:hypothetical protein